MESILLILGFRIYIYDKIKRMNKKSVKIEFI